MCIRDSIFACGISHGKTLNLSPVSVIQPPESLFQHLSLSYLIKKKPTPRNINFSHLKYGCKTGMFDNKTQELAAR